MSQLAKDLVAAIAEELRRRLGAYGHKFDTSSMTVARAPFLEADDYFVHVWSRHNQWLYNLLITRDKITIYRGKHGNLPASIIDCLIDESDCIATVVRIAGMADNKGKRPKQKDPYG